MDFAINTNPKTNSVDWEKLFSMIGDVEKTSDVNGKETFTITTRTEGETRTATISIPEDLELPDEVNAESLGALVAKLETSGLGFTPDQISEMKDAVSKLYNESANALKEVKEASSSSSGKKTAVLFDIYSLMALMIDVAQSQRNATREMRTAQNLSIQNSIQNQADSQRQAALTGMIAGIVCGVASAAVSAGLMTAQGVAAKTQSNIMSQSGADASKMQSRMIQQTDSKANSQTQLHNTMQKVGDDVATNVIGKFESSISNSRSGDLRGNLNEAVANNDAAKTNLDTAKTELQTAETTLAERTATRNQLQEQYDAHPDKNALTAADEKQAYIDSENAANRVPDQNRLAEFDQRIGNADLTEIRGIKTQLDTANQEVTNAESTVRTKQGNVRIAQEELQTSNQNLDKARSDYQSTVNDVASHYKEQYQTAVDRLANPPEGSDMAQLKTDVQNAKANMEMAFAAQADLLAGDNVMTPTQRTELVQTCRTEAENAMQRVYNRTDFKAAERRMSTLMGVNNINQALGGVLQSMTQNWSAMLQSDATQQGAETSKEEEMLDQTKDLFSQEGELISQVIQLCQAVIQTENQSMRDAIQA